MSVRTDIRSFWHLYQELHRRAQAVDRLGFGYSRTDTDTTGPARVPDGVELHFFTGRTRTHQQGGTR
ncbi:hypothetical protein QLQ12_06200 [Actinoplanes sp. NEAU-A12]|uniref:Uncharacterized protein n=1 Tax=Actinoplanes sandaracinus TaxID=3045177 RepID=A0ABT6WEP8_9ACTN|nr:hypothetical protein [Actinoplanes sandaracinus]MDI6098194.1 hypothetical protein [Actinoplanes sandaracinus]